MNYWMWLWKAVFVIGVAAFAIMAVWVTIAGFGDIKRLIETIRKSHDDEES